MIPHVIVAKTIYGMARREGLRGMAAFANLIANREAHPSRGWGAGWIDVCLKPAAFSCWRPSERHELEQLTESDPDYLEALMIARETVHGALPDRIKGADRYVVGPHIPSGRVTERIGRFTFYRD